MSKQGQISHICHPFPVFNIVIQTHIHKLTLKFYDQNKVTQYNDPVTVFLENGIYIFYIQYA